MRTIKKKLVSSFIVIALLALLIGVISIVNFKRTERSFEEMLYKTINVSVVTKDMSLLLGKIVSEIDVMALSKDTASLEKTNTDIVDNLRLFTEEIERLKKVKFNTSSQRHLKEIESKLTYLNKKREDVFNEIKELIVLEEHLQTLYEEKTKLVDILAVDIAGIIDKLDTIVQLSSENKEVIHKIETNLNNLEELTVGKQGVVATKKEYISVRKKSEEVMGKCKKTSAEMVGLCDIILDKTREEANTIVRTTKNVLRNTRAVVMVVVAAAFVMSLALSFFLVRSIIFPLNNMVGVIKHVAQGDLTKKIAVNGRDEVGEIASNFSIMVTNLNRILYQLQKAVNDVTSAGNEILAASEQQAAGAREQSSAVAETTSAAAELSKTSEQIGEKIRIVSNTAQHVMAGMLKIKEAIGKTGATITSLNENTQKISRITELIDDVTDQTNLLAVNAAIEAARAGEQGRGFTVVADEIRKLSDSTAKSTKDIIALIEIIQNEMTNAIVSMDESVKSVEKQLQLAHDSVEHAKEISMGVTQQVSGTRQIAEAMGNIDETMRQIVSGAQQSQNASRHLTKLAGELKETSAKFKILDGELKNGI